MEKIYNGITCKYKCNPEETNVIYMLAFPNNKKYIGQTVQSLQIRMRQHCSDATIDGRQWNVLKCRAMRKYKFFEVSVIDKCGSVDELNRRESEVIDEYLDKGEALYNVASGGLNSCEYFGKSCVITDLNFNKLKQFEKVKEAREWIGSSGQVSKYGKRYIKISGKYYLFHREDYLNRLPVEHRKSREELRIAQEEDTSPKVLQIKYNHELISSMSLRVAKLVYGKGVESAVHSKTKRMYGYYWMLEEKYNDLIKSGTNIESVISGMDYILKVDNNEEIIGEYYTVKDAAKQNRISCKKVRRSLYSGHATSEGYVFRLYSEYVSRGLSFKFDKHAKKIPSGKATQVIETLPDGSKIYYQSIKQYAAAYGISYRTGYEAVVRGSRYGINIQILTK